jgi:hypothetical protein
MSEGAAKRNASLTEELAALHERPLRSPRWHRLATRTAVALVALAIVGGIVAALAAGSRHYDITVLNPASCPSVNAIDSFLGTKLSGVSAIHEGDLVSCNYRQGSGSGPALAVDVDQPNTGIGANNAIHFGTDDPCRGRPAIRLAGHRGCDMTGTAATPAGRPSFLLQDGSFDFQVTSYVADISKGELERLAAALVTPHPDEA